MQRFTPLALALLMFVGCNSEDLKWKQTVPVTGKVTIDGAAPNPPVQVELINDSGYDTERPTVSRGETDEQGVFTISTYVKGDGAPVGEYSATFKWQPYNLMSRGYGKDKFKGRYADPRKSETKVTIAEDAESVDIGTVDLKSK